MKLFSSNLIISAAMLLFYYGIRPAETIITPAETHPVITKPQFIPFKVVVIQHKVKNFEKAEAGYFKSDSLRKIYGITHYVLGRDLIDPNTVFVVDKIEDVERARAYFMLPAVVAAMKNSGVSQAPGYTYAEMVRSAETPAVSEYHLAVSYHVIDFDKWLKAYDAEGMPARAANGLIDQAIARNFYDPNTISVLFTVSDMEKARARMKSPELRQLMADAGVDGTPTTRWYREVK